MCVRHAYAYEGGGGGEVEEGRWRGEVTGKWWRAGGRGVQGRWRGGGGRGGGASGGEVDGGACVCV